MSCPSPRMFIWSRGDSNPHLAIWSGACSQLTLRPHICHLHQGRTTDGGWKLLARKSACQHPSPIEDDSARKSPPLRSAEAPAVSLRPREAGVVCGLVPLCLLLLQSQPLRALVTRASFAIAAARVGWSVHRIRERTSSPNEGTPARVSASSNPLSVLGSRRLAVAWRSSSAMTIEGTRSRRSSRKRSGWMTSTS